VKQDTTRASPIDHKRVAPKTLDDRRSIRQINPFAPHDYFLQ
jgi:hypothetical protein